MPVSTKHNLRRPQHKKFSFQEAPTEWLSDGCADQKVCWQVEADYGFGDEMNGEDEEEEQQLAAEQMPESGEAGPEHRDTLAEAGLSAAEDAPADQEWPGFSADAAVEGMPMPQEKQMPSTARHAQQSSMEGLPEGELLSPDKAMPRLKEEVKSEITAGINFGGTLPSGDNVGQEIDFDGWGAEADGDWGFN